MKTEPYAILRMKHAEYDRASTQKVAAFGGIYGNILVFEACLEDGPFAVNCGVVGKPDHDGDPAVHYALLDLSGNTVNLNLQCVEYDYETWTETLAEEGVDPIFVEPLKTGIWTTGVSSLPALEKQRYQLA